MYLFFSRLLQSLFLLVGVSLLTFVLADLAPGDFYDVMRLNPHISPATIESIKAEHGLTQSLPVRYYRWLRSTLTGDWGFSLSYNAPAAPILRSRSLNTLLLTGFSTLGAWVVALLLGIAAAVSEQTRATAWIDRLLSVLSSLFLATPEIVLGLLLLLFALRTRLFPVGGFASLRSSEQGSWHQTADVARHLVLPAVCLGMGLLPVLFSHVRQALCESLASSYVAAARSHGVPFRRAVFRHALPAAANPLISLFGLSLGMLLSSSLLIEILFSWPGLGQLMVEALFQRDPALIVDSALLASAFLIAGNLVADLLLYAADPRIGAT